VEPELKFPPGIQSFWFRLRIQHPNVSGSGSETICPMENSRSLYYLCDSLCFTN